jgi:hypothetical protein
MAKEHNLPKLEASINDLINSLGDLGNGKDVKPLLRMIHQPWFTTVAEYKFLLASMVSLTEQVESVNRLKASVLAAANAIEAR